MYALNLDAETGRILSACVVLPSGFYEDMPVVDAFPDGDLCEYLYVDGEYVHDPLPAPEVPEKEPTTAEILNAMLGVTE